MVVLGRNKENPLSIDSIVMLPIVKQYCEGNMK